MQQGQRIYGALCSSCHGDRGEGLGGPTLANLMEDWPRCSDQISWIQLGSEGWRTHAGETYGAKMKSVEGGMPAYANVLKPEEIQQVSAFIRVEYSGEDVEYALGNCGLGPAP